MNELLKSLENFLGTTGVAKLIAETNWWQYLIMYVIVGVLFYLAIVYLLTFGIKTIEKRLRASDKR